MTHKAFVCSTFVELKEHRARAIRQLRHAGFLVDPMEDWTADPDEPVRFSPERVGGCDLVVLLVGNRGGHLAEGHAESITQLEHEHARRLGIDVLPFLLDEAVADWPARYDERRSDERLCRWRQEIAARHGLGKFTTEAGSLDLGPALSRWLRRRHEHERLGDYRASLRRAHGHIRLLGLPQLKDNPDIRIDRLFVNTFLA